MRATPVPNGNLVQSAPTYYVRPASNQAAPPSASVTDGQRTDLVQAEWRKTA